MTTLKTLREADETLGFQVDLTCFAGLPYPSSLAWLALLTLKNVSVSYKCLEGHSAL